MKTMLMCMSWACIAFLTIVHASERMLHGDFLKDRLDVSRWREFYPDDIWHMRCIVVDMDGDKVDEVVTSSTDGEEDKTGYVWRAWRLDCQGKFRELKFFGDIFFLCHSESFYKVSYCSAPSVVVGLGMNASIEKKREDGMRSKVRSAPDCRFAVMPDNKFTLREIQPDVDTCFRREGVVSIERLYPEWYFGYEFKPPPDDPHSPYTTWCGYSKPKGDLRRGGVEQPKGFGAFASEYRRDVKVRTGVKEKVTVYAVFLDADNDGDADCYVSSSAEGDGKGKYSWTLYLSGEGGYSKAKAAVHPVRDKNCKCELKPKATGRRDSFCRLVRFDVDPTFMLLDEEMSPSAVRDAITNILSHRIEKLECASFQE